MNYNQYPIIDEDPLAGDVDRFVDHNETRSDQQIEQDKQLANRLHMSGDDGADEYWADYDEYFGTVDGGQPEPEAELDTNPKTTIKFSERTPGLMTVITPKGRSMTMGTDWLKHEYFHLTHDEIGEKIDEDEDEYDSYKKQQKEEYSAWDAAHKDQHDEEDERTEDPLAGDVDRWVDPDETKGY